MRIFFFLVTIIIFLPSSSYANIYDSETFYFSFGFDTTSIKNNNLNIINDSYFTTHKDNSFAFGPSLVLGYNWNSFLATELNYTLMGSSKLLATSTQSSNLTHIHEYSFWSNIILLNFVIKAPISNFITGFIKLGVGYIFSNYKDIDYDIRNYQPYWHMNELINQTSFSWPLNKVINKASFNNSLIYNLALGSSFRIKAGHSIYFSYNMKYTKNDLSQKHLIKSFELGYKYESQNEQSSYYYRSSK